MVVISSVCIPTEDGWERGTCSNVHLVISSVGIVVFISSVGIVVFISVGTVLLIGVDIFVSSLFVLLAVESHPPQAESASMAIICSFGWFVRLSRVRLFILPSSL